MSAAASRRTGSHTGARPPACLVSAARTELAELRACLVRGEVDVGHDCGSRGRPSTRSPMMLRWISLLPAAIVQFQDLRWSISHLPDVQVVANSRRSSSHRRHAADVHGEPGQLLQRLAVEQLDDRSLRSDLARSLDVAGQTCAEQAEHLDLGGTGGEVLPDRVVIGRYSITVDRCHERLRRDLVERYREPGLQLENVEARAPSTVWSAPSASRRSRRRPDVLDRDLDVGRGRSRRTPRCRLPAASGAARRRASRMSSMNIDRPRCFGARRVGAREQQAPRRPGRRSSTTPSARSRRRRRRSRTARVRSEARSEPASGSEKPWHQISPSRIADRCFCCSGLPYVISVAAMCARDISSSRGCGKSARTSSSWITSCSRKLNPPPPNSTGQCAASSPASRSSCAWRTLKSRNCARLAVFELVVPPGGRVRDCPGADVGAQRLEVGTRSDAPGGCRHVSAAAVRRAAPGRSSSSRFGAARRARGS